MSVILVYIRILVNEDGPVTAMEICIELLTPERLRRVAGALEQARFRDGGASAGWHAREVKRNLQVPPDDPAGERVRRELREALGTHPVVALAARPRRLGPIILSRYEPGMGYGAHVDDALMGGEAPLRGDLAFTVFLAGPDSYEGGALVLDSPAGERAYRLPAGTMVLYPAGRLHRVEPVTAGVRLAAVGWVQSLVRDAARRELLFELDTARRTLFERHGRSRELDAIAAAVSNLLRMWAET